uniref:Uncharacterized protein n=1 Tax=Anguilla anguilla TaxID=7936 RepID=A0A0E9RVE3_ANGAN
MSPLGKGLFIHPLQFESFIGMVTCFLFVFLSCKYLC